MLRKILAIVVFYLVFSLLTLAFDDTKKEDRSTDEKAVRSHIEKIFQAYVDRDRETVKATHSTNWRGFLTGSNTIIKGIDEYMKGADGEGSFSPQRATKMVSYKFLEYDTVFYGETAIVSYIAELFWQTGEKQRSSKLRAVDVYAKENGNWTQVASNISPLPTEIAKSMSTPVLITPQVRQYLAKVRNEAWQAFFTNDTAKLEKLIPADAVAIVPGKAGFDNQVSILAAAKAFSESGAKLVKLEFPTTEIQIYGTTVIMYSTYVYEVETKGKKESFSGRASEIFVISDSGKDIKNIGWHLDSGN